MKCPTCDYESSEMGVKVHHVQTHDESLAQVEYVCDYCEEVDTRCQSKLTGEKNYCSNECRGAAMEEPHEFVCDNCGKTDTRTKARLEKYENNFCSVSCSAEYNTGENHYRWKGGTERFTLTPEGREWRETVFSNAEHSCEDCGRTGCRLNAHHILRKSEHPEKKADPDNGICVCLYCHARRHFEAGEMNAYRLIKGNIHRLDNV